MAAKSVSASKSLAVFGLTAVMSSGCTMMPPGVRAFGEQLSQEWTALVAVLEGKPSPLAKQSPQPSDGPDARRAKANAEILQEMMRVVWMKDPTDRAHFVGTVDSMNQGASVEGLYHGFTLSGEYRELEARSGVAPAAALRLFVEELVQVEKDLAQPTVFNERSALPLSPPIQPTEADAPADGAVPKELTFPAKAGSPAVSAAPVVAQSAADYERIFSRASIFTLKRVLAEEAVKLVQMRRADRNALAAWYGPFAARTAARGVDFGIPLRNKPDPVFHAQWAQGSSEDQILWEVLNRLHRLLNAQVAGNK